ncbi:hypothetical protein [Embleya sp. NPDC020886]|uniref:hypothetical protein n=1 Tax=Embleya sp. NPDC020886 TaxID=3363980 RepID=UPI0037BCA3F5
MTTYVVPTTWERGSMRITTPRDRLDNGTVSWLCNECGAGPRRPIAVRHVDDVRAAVDAWHAHTCPPPPTGWMTAPADMPCDACRAYTRARSPRGRPLHPACPPARRP